MRLLAVWLGEWGVFSGIPKYIYKSKIPPKSDASHTKTTYPPWAWLKKPATIPQKLRQHSQPLNNSAMKTPYAQPGLKNRFIFGVSQFQTHHKKRHGMFQVAARQLIPSTGNQNCRLATVDPEVLMWSKLMKSILSRDQCHFAGSFIKGINHNEVLLKEKLGAVVMSVMSCCFPLNGAIGWKSRSSSKDIQKTWPGCTANCLFVKVSGMGWLLLAGWSLCRDSFASGHGEIWSKWLEKKGDACRQDIYAKIKDACLWYFRRFNIQQIIVIVLAFMFSAVHS